ncbi:signal peptidase I [Nocardioides sp. zg-ZUI104]|uniref:signal peptidase I n=1 Tax=Nocardioides faecalis TaxID=2803858 RepID=UPI001BCCA71E|nr:signal peptidase I [Nocardioides faecalis]MBS4753084.1 signal peptidase I [Nocardioides faecalis]
MAEKQKRSALRRTGSALGNLVLLVLVLIPLAYIVPSAFGYERYVITGGSMSGTFEKGSLVFEEPVPVEELAVGDIITYLPPPDSGVQTLVTHRIVEMGSDENGRQVLITQGDANPDPDPWKFSLTADTQPVVRAAVPHVGWVLIAMADREIRMLSIGIPAGLIALMSLVELLGALRPSIRAAAKLEAERAAAEKAAEKAATLAARQAEQDARKAKQDRRSAARRTGDRRRAGEQRRAGAGRRVRHGKTTVTNCVCSVELLQISGGAQLRNVPLVEEARSRDLTHIR